jgi:stress response protein SCP2
MKQLMRGERLPLAPHAPAGNVQVGLSLRGLAPDFACFALDALGKLVDDRYMTFFNQPASPCGAIALGAVGGDKDGFVLQLGRLPASVERIVVTASIEDAVMSQLASGALRLVGDGGEFARFECSGQDFAREQAVMLGEFYRKDGQWRFMAVGQGFNGGLAALVRHFGASVADSLAAPAVAPRAPAPAVNLEKRVAEKAPQLVNLVKSAGVSLAKVGLDKHRAKVCLVLDISGSMGGLYRKGLVQRFAERILALGCRFDDDGEIDVFLFGSDVHQPAPMGLGNWSEYVKNVIARHPLEGGTRYGAAMEAVRRFYFPDAAGGERMKPHKAALPVYVMFVTDGSTHDEALTERQLRWASHEPIFWQFMGIGKSSKGKGGFFSSLFESDFSFLEKLDDLQGRFVDNANFFSVASPDAHPDAELYDLLMAEYPSWVNLVRQRGLLD